MVWYYIAGATFLAGVIWFSKWFADQHRDLFRDVQEAYREQAKRKDRG